MKIQQDAVSGFRFTGWHMLATMVAFFGVVISVNVFMAYNAVSTWSGLVVPNTYVASQQFNGKVAEARKRAAIGLDGTMTIDADVIRYSLVERDGSPAIADLVTINFRRPVGEAQDFSLTLESTGPGKFEARHDVGSGQWVVEALVTRNGETVLHEADRISVKGEAK